MRLGAIIHPCTGRRTCIAVSVVATMIAGGIGAVDSAGSVPHQPTRQVSARHKLRVPRILRPVASTSDRTAFGHPYAILDQINRTPVPHENTARAGRLIALTTNRRRYRIGSSKADVDFSMTGKVLTAAGNGRRVDWWRPGVSRHDHGATKMPAQKPRYLTSTPHGWLYATPQGRLFAQRPGGHHPRLLASPFAGSTGDYSYWQATSGPHGVVVTDRKQVVYINDSNRSVTTLDTSGIPDGDDVSCYAVTATAATCGAHRGFFSHNVTTIFRAPLNGSAPSEIEPTGSCRLLDQPVVLGRTTAFEGCKHHLTLLRDGHRITSKVRVPSRVDDPSPLVPGDHRILLDDASDSQVMGVDKHGASHRLMSAAHSRTEAWSFSLSDGVIVWRQDNVGPKPALGTVEGRSVRTTSHGLAVGPVHAIGPTLLGKRTIVNDGQAVVWAKQNESRATEQTLRVTSAVGRLSIHHVDPREKVSLTRHRLLYFHGADDAPIGSQTAELLNLRTLRSHAIQAIEARLSGQHLLVLKASGDLILRTLGSSQATVVTQHLSSDSQIYLHGTDVGWNTTVCVDHKGCLERSSIDRTAVSSLPVAAPKGQAIWSLTDAGFVFEPRQHVSDPPRALRNSELGFYSPDPFYLQPYSSSQEHLVLTGGSFLGGPQISDGVIAWINKFGVLKARKL